MRITILSGAGISVPSGIPDYRSNDSSFWNKNNPIEVATKDALIKNPDHVNRFFFEKYINLKDKQPNHNHLEITKLQEYHEVNVITQNIDDLHEKAGNKNVYHLHGKLWEFYDENKKIISGDNIDFTKIKRPNVVLFGEDVMSFNTIINILKGTNLYISIGTSNNVAPANRFHTFLNSSCKKIAINKEYPFYIKEFNHFIQCDLSIDNPLENIDKKDLSN